LRNVIVVLASFLACAVEMVEALTIVLAVAVTRGWRSVRLGVAAALVTLTLVVAALGPALTRLPLGALRVVVGFLLLVFGLQWLRKAILRASGYLALHDEEMIFEREVAAARGDQSGVGEVRGSGPIDWYAFTLSFKGVFLEGLEVAFIVVTFGAAHNDFSLTALSAVAALLVVGLVGVVVHRPLSQVPENTMKFAVGLMLTSFGTFWGAEGAGAHWPGSDAAILAVLAVYAVFAFGSVAILRARRDRASAAIGAV
jgi:uncharacterized membrane protein